MSPLPISLVLLLLSSPLLGVAGPTTAGHLDLDLVHTEQVEGSAAFGVAVDTAEDGPVRVTLAGEAPRRSTSTSSGVVVYDEKGEWRFQVVIFHHRSPDRLLVLPTPADPSPSSQPGQGDWVVNARGDASVLEDVNVTFEVQPGGGGAEPAAKDTVMTAGVTDLGTTAGTHYVGIWVGEVSTSTLKVATNAAVDDVRTSPGTAHVAGDLELERSTTDVQVQQTPLDAGLLLRDAAVPLGVKVLKDATKAVQAENGLWGIWGHYEWKSVCAGLPWQRLCVYTEAVYDVCRNATGLDCSTAHLSWEGPGGEGAMERTYAFSGAPAGPYTFSVDQKVDLYGPRYSDRDTGSAVVLHEHWSMLSVGDFVLPS